MKQDNDPQHSKHTTLWNDLRAVRPNAVRAEPKWMPTSQRTEPSMNWSKRDWKTQTESDNFKLLLLKVVQAANYGTAGVEQGNVACMNIDNVLHNTTLAVFSWQILLNLGFGLWEKLV